LNAYFTGLPGFLLFCLFIVAIVCGAALLGWLANKLFAWLGGKR
jgi:hypothetical protein